jgi:hypothetical protein
MDIFILKTKDGELRAEGFANHGSFEVHRGTLTTKVIPPDAIAQAIEGVSVRIEDIFTSSYGGGEYYNIQFKGQILFNPSFIERDGNEYTFCEEKPDADLAEYIENRYIEGALALEHAY